MASRTARAELVRPEAGEKSPSGRLLLRMPRTLHADLARAAEREGTSLNAFITGALASTIGWRGTDGELTAGPTVRTQTQGQTRLLLVVLVANAVVVGLAALAALGVLLFAWLG